MLISVAIVRLAPLWLAPHRRDGSASLSATVQRMVGWVLTGNGITTCEQGSYAFRTRTPINGSVKVRVLTKGP